MTEADEKLIEKIEDRMRQAEMNEDVGPCIGPVYGTNCPPVSVEEQIRQVSIVNVERERERCAKIAENYYATTLLEDEGHEIAREIAAKIREGK